MFDKYKQQNEQKQSADIAAKNEAFRKEQAAKLQKNNENKDLGENKDLNENKEFGETKIPEIKIVEKTNEEKINDLTSTLQRLQAEFENSQKRNQRQNAEYREFATANLIEQLLPVLDTLEQGIKHNKEFAIILEQVSLILKKNGLEKIRVEEGNEFDHDKMECLMQEESDKIKEGKVAKVLLTGYMMNNKILRLVKVSISGGKKKEEIKEKIQNQEIKNSEIKSEEVKSNGKVEEKK